MPLHTETELLLEHPNQLKALGDETRSKILRILETRKASAKELSGLLDMTHGKVGHHLKVLHEAGLVEVVEERQVRAMTEKLYGLTFTRLRFAIPDTDRLSFTLAQAAREAAAEQPFDPPAALFTVRLSMESAERFHERLLELADEFSASQEQTGEVFGFIGSVFATDTPS